MLSVGGAIGAGSYLPAPGPEAVVRPTPQEYAASVLADDDVIDLSSALNEVGGDRYEIDYLLKESGGVTLLGQNGEQNLTGYVYCEVPDPVYIELWEEALANWEAVLTVGAEDVDYPYEVDGETIAIDDLYLYFGFSDSYGNATTLGSSINGGYCRSDGLGLPATGSLVFNAGYFTADPTETVRTVFYNTALHEMAHALGYNLSFMNKLGLVERSFDAPYDLTSLVTGGSSYYYYVGEQGVAEYNALFPQLAELGANDRFAMETYSTSGSFGTHPSSIYATYFFNYNQRDGMNYAISGSYRATISSMTLAVLQDLGYQVDRDFADPISSPAPVELEALPTDQGVYLEWKSSKGATNSETTFMPTYTVQRCDITSEPSVDERIWVDVAEGVDDTNYLDVTAEQGKTYLYRVAACNVRSNPEAGIFRAKEGDTISWESTPGTTANVYALTNNGNNKFVWSRVFQSQTESSWTVEPPENSTASTIYRVIIAGAAVAETEPSKAVAAVIPEAEERRVVEGGRTLLEAAENDDPDVEYWWDLSNSKESVEANYIQGSRELWFSTDDYKLQPGESFTVRSRTRENGKWSSTKTTTIVVEKSWPGFEVTALPFLDGQALRLTLESKLGRAASRWAIDWGDGSEIEVVDAAGFKLTSTHYYETGKASDYAVAFAIVDSNGLYYESEPFKAPIAPTLDDYWAELAVADELKLLEVFG